MSKPKLDCAETFRHLDDFVDRELTKQELADVEEHLAACADCTGEFAVERELLDRIKNALRRLPIPDGLKQRISERLAKG